MAIGAIRFSVLANSLILTNSASDSTLKQPIDASKAALISSVVLPTPENTIFSAAPPAWITRASSPTETISKPAPHLAKVA